MLGNGDTTSFWQDTWSESGVRREVLPALYSHFRDTDATVAEVIVADGFPADTLQSRLSTAARAELALLDTALTTVNLQPHQDERRLQRSRSPVPRARDFYTALRTPPASSPPLGEVNWDCLAPKKVKVFFRIL